MVLVEDQVGDRIDQAAEDGAFAGQGHLGRFAVGDVGQHRHDAADLTLGIVQGAAEMLTSMSEPSLRRRWASTPAKDSPRSTRSRKVCVSGRLWAGTSGEGRPSASASAQPNIRVAAAFQLRMLPVVSRARMASGDA